MARLGLAPVILCYLLSSPLLPAARTTENKLTVLEQCAFDYIKAHENDGNVAAYFKTNLLKGNIAARVEHMISVGLAIKVDGMECDSPLFVGFWREQLGTEVPAEPSGSALAPTEAQKSEEHVVVAAPAPKSAPVASPEVEAAKPTKKEVVIAENQPETTKEPAPAVLDDDKLEFSQLVAESDALKTNVAVFRAIKEPPAQHEAAARLIAQLEPALNENLAHQEWLKGKAAAQKADATLKDVQATAVAKAAANDQLSATGLLESRYQTLHEALARKHAVRPTDQPQYDKLLLAEVNLTKDLDSKKLDVTAAKTKQQATKDTLANASATSKEKDDARTEQTKIEATLPTLNAALVTAQEKLDANVAEQKKIHAEFYAESAKNLADAIPTPANKAALAQVEKNLSAVEAGSRALSDKVTFKIADTKANFSRIQGYFHTGVTLLNPYRITKHAAVPAGPATDSSPATPEIPANLTIESASSTDTNAFLEFVYSNRWAWNKQRIINTFTSIPGPDNFKFDRREQWDVQARLGYSFTSNGSSGTANTLVGSGNFNADIAVGKPVLLFRSIDETSYFSVGPEFAYGIVTDKDALSAHKRVFGGIAFSTAFKDPFGSLDVDSSLRHVLLHFRLGAARIDTVRYVSDDSRKIVSINDNLPRYFAEPAFAFETELLYPVKSSTFVIFGGHVYTGVTPNPWSIQIGITTSFNDLVDGFFK